MLQLRNPSFNEEDFKLEQAGLLFDQQRFHEAAIIYRTLLLPSFLRNESRRLVIDYNAGSVRTAEKWKISFGRQHVLFSILRVLSENRTGVGKDEIVRRVWGEAYAKNIHDNRLFYNINRLRKLVEVDSRRPRYILNSTRGYQLASDIEVKIVAHKQGEKR